MASAAKALASDGGASSLHIWTGLSIAASWLTSQSDRDRMLATVTAQPHDALYIRVAGAIEEAGVDDAGGRGLGAIG